MVQFQMTLLLLYNLLADGPFGISLLKLSSSLFSLLSYFSNVKQYRRVLDLAHSSASSKLEIPRSFISHKSTVVIFKAPSPGSVCTV